MCWKSELCRGEKCKSYKIGFLRLFLLQFYSINRRTFNTIIIIVITFILSLLLLRLYYCYYVIIFITKYRSIMNDRQCLLCRSIRICCPSVWTNASIPLVTSSISFLVCRVICSAPWIPRCSSVWRFLFNFAII